MKHRSGAAAPRVIISCAALLLAAVANAAVSDSMGSSASVRPGDQAGAAPKQAASAAPSGMTDQDIKTEAAKISIAPHSIAVETALMNAIDQVKGLKAQIRTAQNQPTSDFILQYRMHSREIKDALNTARAHEGDLKSRAGKFPSVARTEEYRQLSPALSDVERLSQQWEKQSSAPGYWRDATKVSSDLDQLEKRLNNALDKSRSFNSRMDISSVS